MTLNDNAAADSSVTANGNPLRREIDFNTAYYRLASAIASLRAAIHAADDAPGTVMIRPQDCTPAKMVDMQVQWLAASCVIHEALDDVTRHGSAFLVATLSVMHTE